MPDNVQAKLPVTIHLHRTFHLPGDPQPPTTRVFWELFAQAQQHLLCAREAEQEMQMAQLLEYERQMSARFVVLEQVGKGKAGFAEAQQRLHAIGFTDAEHKSLMKELAKGFLAFAQLPKGKRLARPSPKEKMDIEAQQARNEAERKRLEISGEIIEQGVKVTQALGALSDYVQAGHEKAAEQLLFATVTAVQLLSALAREHPELLRPTTRQMAGFPVMALLDPGWSEDAKTRLRELEVGADNLQGRFSTAAYDDTEISPARAYARAAVDTLAANRRGLEHASVISKLFLNHLPDYQVSFASIPAWAKKAVELPDFDRKQANAWFELSKEMIRAEFRDFHLRPEWNRYRARFRGATKGEIQNRLFDLLKSAVRTIARGKARGTS